MDKETVMISSLPICIGSEMHSAVEVGITSLQEDIDLCLTFSKCQKVSLFLLEQLVQPMNRVTAVLYPKTDGHQLEYELTFADLGLLHIITKSAWFLCQ